MIEEGGSLMTDFESAPHIAKNKVLSLTPLIPGSKVVKSKGCNFHFSSGVMKDSKFYSNRKGVFITILCSTDNVSQKLKLLYDKNDEHRADVRLLRMLVYVPEADVQRAFAVVSRQLEEKGSQATKLLARLDKYYIHGRVVLCMDIICIYSI